MNQTMKLTRKQADPIIQATFPSYRGRKIWIEFAESVTLWDMNWSGGTCNQYKGLMADGKLVPIPAPAPWDNLLEGQTIKLSPASLLVERKYFCGQDCGIRIFAHVSHLPKWIEA